MPAAAQEEMFSPPMVRRGEEIFFLAAAVAAEVETPIVASKANNEKPHEGVARQNRAPHLGQAVCNCTIALGVSWCWWSETALGAGDSYDYDAFGNLTNSTGSTPNVYLFAGEQFDPALNLYYNRARYLNTTTGRFWSMDTAEGNNRDPLSLHKYLYAEGNPVDNLDPSGNEIDEVMGGLGMMDTINAIPIISLRVIVALKRALLYQVVVVTPSSGAAYEPQSKVKNSAQAVVSGWPVGTPIRIAVPPGIDPQTMVDQWRSSSAWSSRSALNPRTWFAFKKFWSDPANNFKSRSAIFDAFGNFEFGATGAAAFFGLPALEAAADYLHGGTNDPINRTDIASGYEAIEKGGKLSTTAEKLVP